MIPAYLILLAIACLFKTFHFPGYPILLLFSVFLPLLDLLIQGLRKKEDKQFRIFSSLAVFGFSFFLLFKILNWPGSNVVFLFSVICTVPFLITFFRKRYSGIRSFRYAYLVLIAGFSVFLLSMNKSSRIEFFCWEDPMNPNDHVPPIFIQNLAFAYYEEGNRDQALALIERAIDECNSRANSNEFDQPAYLMEHNLTELKKDSLEIVQKNWKFPHPLMY